MFPSGAEIAVYETGCCRYLTAAWGLFVGIWMLSTPPDPPEFGNKVAFVQFTDIQCAESTQIISQAQVIQSLTNETIPQQRTAGTLMEDMNMERIIDVVGRSTEVGMLNIFTAICMLVSCLFVQRSRRGLDHGRYVTDKK